MTRHLPQLLGWLLALVGIALLWRLERPAAEVGAPVTMLLTYPLDEGLRLSLEPGETQVRLITWLEPPPGWPLDPRLTLPYGIAWEATGPDGEVLGQGQDWESTHVGRELLATDHLRATAWRVPEQSPLGEDRTVVLGLDGLAPRGGVLELHAAHVPPGARVLVAAYRRVSQSTATQLTLLEDETFQADVVRDLGAVGWEAVPSPWRRRLAERRWDRLGALPPETGGLPPVVRVGATFLHDPVATGSADGVLVGPGAALAWNLRGPATFSATWAAPEGGPAEPVAARLRLVHPDGTMEERPVPVGEGTGPVELRDELVSVQLALEGAEGPRLVRTRVTGEPFGAPPRRGVAEDGSARLGADLRSVELYRVDPARSALHFALDAAEDARLVARVRLPPGALPGFAAPAPEPGARLHVRTLGEDGRELGAWTWDVPAVPSPFERYTQGDDPASARVAEAVHTALAAPEGTARVEVRAEEGVVDLVLQVASGAAEELDPAYVLPPELPLRTRFAPLRREAWLARAPVDVEALFQEGRVVHLDGQVRLEPAPPGPPPERWGPVPLPGAYELVVEREAGAGGDAARARLGPDGAAVRVGADGRVVLDWRVDPTQVGGQARVEVGDRSFALPLRSAGGRSELRGLPPGRALVRVLSPGLWFAREPVDGSWLVRRVTPLAPEAERRLGWRTTPTAFAVHVYLAPGTPGELWWRLGEGGAPPPGLHTVQTAREGRVSLATAAPSAALPLSFAAGGLAHLGPVLVRVGEDLGVGPGVLTVGVRGTDRPVWIRVRSTDPPAPVPAGTQRSRKAGEP